MSTKKKLIAYAILIHASVLVACMLRVYSKLYQSISIIFDLLHLLFLLSIPIFSYFAIKLMKKEPQSQIELRKFAILGTIANVLVLIVGYFVFRESILSYVMSFGLNTRKSETVVLFSAFATFNLISLAWLSICFVKS